MKTTLVKSVTGEMFNVVALGNGIFRRASTGELLSSTAIIQGDLTPETSPRPFSLETFYKLVKSVSEVRHEQQLPTVSLWYKYNEIISMLSSFENNSVRIGSNTRSKTQFGIAGRYILSAYRSKHGKMNHIISCRGKDITEDVDRLMLHELHNLCTTIYNLHETYRVRTADELTKILLTERFATGHNFIEGDARGVYGTEGTYRDTPQNLLIYANKLVGEITGSDTCVNVLNKMITHVEALLDGKKNVSIDKYLDELDVNVTNYRMIMRFTNLGGSPYMLKFIVGVKRGIGTDSIINKSVEVVSTSSHRSMTSHIRSEKNLTIAENVIEAVTDAIICTLFSSSRTREVLNKIDNDICIVRNSDEVDISEIISKAAPDNILLQKFALVQYGKTLHELQKRFIVGNTKFLTVRVGEEDIEYRLLCKHTPVSGEKVKAVLPSNVPQLLILGTSNVVEIIVP